jgi:uncharacterized lipoprotein YbaY
VTRRGVGAMAAGLIAATLLAGCSGGADDEPGPESASTSVAPSSARTPPPISPRTTVSLSPGTTLPPSADTAVPVPSEPVD